MRVAAAVLPWVAVLVTTLIALTALILFTYEDHGSTGSAGPGTPLGYGQLAFGALALTAAVTAAVKRSQWSSKRRLTVALGALAMAALWWPLLLAAVE